MINTNKPNSGNFPEFEEEKMTNEEKLRKIIDRTGITTEQAQEALDKFGGDLLDAMIYVERTYVKAAKQAQNTQTAQQSAQAAQPDMGAAPQPEYTAQQQTEPTSGCDIGAAAAKAWSVLSQNWLVLSREGKELVSLPMYIVLLVLLVRFDIALLAAICAMFFGVSYRVKGEKLGKMKVNFVLDTVYAMVQNLKSTLSGVK